VTSGKLDTSELVELLNQSAVEHLTTFRQLESQKFGSVIIIVTTDFEALYVVCSCLSRTYMRWLVGSHCHIYAYWRVQSVFSWWMTTLSHSLDSRWLQTRRTEAETSLYDVLEYSLDILW